MNFSSAYQYIPHIFIIFLVIYLTSTLKVLSENQRFAVYKLGRFMGFKGPGLVIKLPGKSTDQWIKLTLGDKGKLIAPNIGLFQEAQLPVVAEDNVKVDSIIRIISFNKSTIAVMLDPDQRRTITCEKCGHTITL